MAATIQNNFQLQVHVSILARLCKKIILNRKETHLGDINMCTCTSFKSGAAAKRLAHICCSGSHPVDSLSKLLKVSSNSSRSLIYDRLKQWQSTKEDGVQ